MGGRNPQKRTEHCRLSGWSFVARNIKGLKKKKKRSCIKDAVGPHWAQSDVTR